MKRGDGMGVQPLILFLPAVLLRQRRRPAQNPLPALRLFERGPALGDLPLALVENLGAPDRGIGRSPWRQPATPCRGDRAAACAGRDRRGRPSPASFPASCRRRNCSPRGCCAVLVVYVERGPGAFRLVLQAEALSHGAGPAPVRPHALARIIEANLDRSRLGGLVDQGELHRQAVPHGAGDDGRQFQSVGGVDLDDLVGPEVARLDRQRQRLAFLGEPPGKESRADFSPACTDKAGKPLRPADGRNPARSRVTLE